MMFSSCENYLDIVPDGTQQLNLIFNRKEKAYNALANCYSYLPQNDGVYSTNVLLSDELTTPVAKETDAIRIMKGQQSVSTPLYGFWSGYSVAGKGQDSLWQAIRSCNILIENIDQVVDMNQTEKNQWKAEAQFLKAYYHFLLLNQYGPIPIIDTNIPISADDATVRVERNTVDECFSYVVQTIDKSIENLPKKVIGTNNLGRIDQVIAKAIKSRILLYSASPLFNGNSAFYSTFLNKKGTPFFNLKEDPKKWELAATASKEALDFAKAEGATLYVYNDSYPVFDSYNSQFEFIRKQYNTRFVITKAWNSELLWGNSNPVTGWWRLQAASLMKNPAASATEASWQWVSPTMAAVEMYYTKNGLPINEDLSFDYTNRFSVATIGFNQRFYAQTGDRTAKINLDREPRFYASIGFDRGINRSWGSLWNLKMRAGEAYGRKANTNDYLITGYALKKIVHPDSEGSDYSKLISYPWPIIRLGELYLNYAEALNELNGPSQEIYDLLNAIRDRAGVPSIELAWSNPAIAKTLNKHTTKEGLRDIIRQERMIELAFEGNKYNDIRRWKLANLYFTTPVKGWTVDESKEVDYYTLRDVGIRSFKTPRDYFAPISFQEMSVNPNLVQNPGW